MGDSRAFIAVAIKPTVANAQVKVVARLDGLSEESSFEGTLGEANKEYIVAPLMRFDSHKLATLEQPLPTTVLLSVKVNGTDLGQQTRSVQVRAVNDVPLLIKDSDGKVQDLSPLFVAFVNENSPIIDTILDEALHQWKAVPNFAGYQVPPADVQMQVFAIWNVLQRHHVKYSSITTASGYSEDSKSQSVRFVDDAWRVGQANCVDGSVLFASVLYKIGLYPVLVKLPGHMFVGYYTEGKSYGTAQSLQFLETTMVGAAGFHQPSAYNIAFNPLIHPARSSESYNQFVQAVNTGNAEFQKEVLPGLQGHKPGFMLIDVRHAREKGITPISH